MANHNPMPSSPAPSVPRNTLTIVAICGMFCCAGVTGIGITTAIKTPNTPTVAKKTAKTMVEMRAQFFSRQSPTLLAIPHTAGTT